MPTSGALMSRWAVLRTNGCLAAALLPGSKEEHRHRQHVAGEVGVSRGVAAYFRIPPPRSRSKPTPSQPRSCPLAVFPTDAVLWDSSIVDMGDPALT